ncbi:unnamed protein product [Gongylonema pulchrum]|uniref:F-actin-capping protein subunit beta n=1 Tax=Gongylonema pulchrum TaxID=637853 RepID=A0A3P6QQH4_9BILA|nr:unnamed protein product [Gongylonema pulchrum]
MDDGALPSDKLRNLEIEMNAALEAYRDAYFEGGVSSVYFWDLDYGFAGVVLIKKIGDGLRNIEGCWDSIHVIEIQEKYQCEEGFFWTMLHWSAKKVCEA